MKKLTVTVIGFAFLLFASSANAAEGDECTVDADCVPINLCKVGSCSSENSTCVEDDKDCGDYVCDELDGNCVECLVDADCDEASVCVDKECVADFECESDEDCPAGVCEQGDCVECREDLDCADNGTPFCSDSLVCVECLADIDCVDNQTAGSETPFCSDSLECVECLADIDCADNGTPFCGDSLECVECLDDIDCADGEVCDLGVCAEEAACGLFIKPPVLNVGKKGMQAKQMFTITGEEGFDPYGDIVFGPFEIYDSFVAGNDNVLKVKILVPGDVEIEGESFDVSVGSCVGLVYVKTPGFDDAEKEQKRLERQERKEAKRAEKEEKKLEKQEKKGNKGNKGNKGK